MERLGETLKRLGIDAAILAAASDPRPIEEEPPACSRCRDAGFLRADVPVGHPDFGRIFPCECRQTEIRQQQRQRLERYSNLGPLTRLTFESLLRDGIGVDPRRLFPKALEAAEQFARQPTGWLVLLGPPGCGKTHLAAAIANERINLGERAFFCIVPDLLDHLRATFYEGSDVRYDELFETVRETPLLVLDDLGAQSSTPWAQEKLFQLLNHRYNGRLPTVITTNLRLEQMDERLRVRLSDPTLCDLQLVREWENKALQRLSRQALDGLRAMTFDSFDERGAGFEPAHFAALRAAKQRARAFASTPSGWLILSGESARGKTHLAAAIANFRESRDEEVFFVTAPDLLDYLRATYAPDSKTGYDEVFEAVRATPLLVLDDLGAQSSTPWAEEKLYQLLNYRYNARLPTVITTSNLEEQEPRLYSRMVDSQVSTVCHLDLPAYRGNERSVSRGRGRGRR